jgi:hypothetical protein
MAIIDRISETNINCGVRMPRNAIDLIDKIDFQSANPHYFNPINPTLVNEVSRLRYKHDKQTNCLAVAHLENVLLKDLVVVVQRYIV